MLMHSRSRAMITIREKWFLDGRLILRHLITQSIRSRAVKKQDESMHERLYIRRTKDFRDPGMPLFRLVIRLRTT